MAVTAAMVKDLRETTGAGMMDCKKALTATDGDKEKAIEWLREKGLANAQKKASRIAAEGLVEVIVADGGHKAVAVEVNSETDFVAKNAKFQKYVDEVAQQALDTKAADMDAFLAEPWKFDPASTVKDALAAEISVIGEKLDIRRFEQLHEENGFIADYTHMGGKVGVLLDVATDVDNAAVREMAKNICMQICALRPKYVSDDEVPEDYKAHETEILRAQIANDPKMAGKPEKVINGAVSGRLAKELKEICLLDQVYVKAEDGKQSVAAYVKEVAKENNANISLKKFVRFETGEGIEKRKEDFAAEVARQING